LVWAAGGVLCCGLASPAAAQDQTLYPRFLANSYAGVQLGYIGYGFSTTQLQPGFQAQSIEVPHLAARVVLFGHEFHKYFSAQVSDMRPVQWVAYQSVNGDQVHHQVWMNIAGLTGKSNLPLTRMLSVYGEAGLGIVTRKGFSIGPSQVVNDASYATGLFGAGLEYRLGDHWGLLTGVTLAPGRSVDKQPTTVFASSGFTYTLRPQSSNRASRSGDTAGWNLVQLGYITDALGYGANNLVSKGAVPVFWAGEVNVANGWSVNYQRLLLPPRRFFELAWGADASTWTSSKRRQRFYTVSAYPVFRFTPLRTNPVTLFLSYSLAGPSMISQTTIDDQKTGRRFTFQDFMSAGAFLGRKRRVAVEVRIAHYSNGNIFPQNPGVTVPLGFYLGSSF
jgi:hypothetical protein